MTKFVQFRDSQLDISGEVAGFYPREFYPFCNFSSFQVKWHGVTWPTSEHAYQASRFKNTAVDLYEKIKIASSAHQAFEIAMANKYRQQKNWDDIKESVMMDICRHKLSQHEYIKKKLLQTADALIVEDSPTDSFWGWGSDRRGRNNLGKIWMKLRDELKEGIVL